MGLRWCWLWLALSVLLLACGSRSSSGENALGGESHFLSACTKGECSDGLECISDICTRECDALQDCEGLSGASACSTGGDLGSKVCDASCDTDTDCGRLGNGFGCEAGFCRDGAGAESCEEGGETHDLGDSWTCSDGCNNCECTRDGVVRTDIECESRTCEQAGEVFEVGDTWTCADGCNTCECTADGIVSTMLDCNPAGCVDGDETSAIGEQWACGGEYSYCICTEQGIATTSINCDCEDGGNSYEVGQQWLCSDGCNQCQCTLDGVVSTDLACEGGCVVDGISYPTGADIPSGDSCNACTCQDDGQVVCTTAECPELTIFTEWDQCADEECLCQALTDCSPAVYASFQALGSDSTRVCARSADTCRVALFTEVEGGGRVFDCEFPREMNVCGSLRSHCTELYTCSLLGIGDECPAVNTICDELDLGGSPSEADAGAN